MTILLYLVPVALCLGLLGLVAFLWALRSGQFDDLDGAAERILFDDDEPGRRETVAAATIAPSCTKATHPARQP